MVLEFTSTAGIRPNIILFSSSSTRPKAPALFSAPNALTIFAFQALARHPMIEKSLRLPHPIVGLKRMMVGIIVLMVEIFRCGRVFPFIKIEFSIAELFLTLMFLVECFWVLLKIYLVSRAETTTMRSLPNFFSTSFCVYYKAILHLLQRITIQSWAEFSSKTYIFIYTVHASYLRQSHNPVLDIGSDFL